MGASGREGASRWFCGVEAALVEEVAKRRLARKRRLAAERWLVARAGADDGEPKLAVKRLLMAAQFLLAALRQRRPGGDGGVSGYVAASEDWRRSGCW